MGDVQIAKKGGFTYTKANHDSNMFTVAIDSINISYYERQDAIINFTARLLDFVS